MRGRTMRNRMTRVEHAVESQPVSEFAIHRAYERFLRKGELEDHRRLAWAVVDRALHARKAAVEAGVRGTPRSHVLREAALAEGPARDAARLLVGLLVRGGLDPTDPEFIPSDLHMPEFGSVALYALGWPDQWVRPHYAAQMERVLRQHAVVRSNHERGSMSHREAAAALAAFLKHGEVPADPVLQSFVLTVGEMFALHAHYFGRGGDDLLAAFEAAAKTHGAERDAALARLGALQARQEV